MSLLVNNPLRTSFKEIVNKAEYKIITDAKTFVEAEPILEAYQPYGSVTAEKRRWVSHKRTIGINPIKFKELFNQLILEFINLTASSEVTLETLPSVVYFNSKGTKSIKKIQKYVPDEVLHVRWIEYDSVYNFSITVRKSKSLKNNHPKKAKLIVVYNVKLPVTMDYFSLKGMSGRMDFRAHFKDLIKNMKIQMNERGYGK